MTWGIFVALPGFYLSMGQYNVSQGKKKEDKIKMKEENYVRWMVDDGDSSPEPFSVN